MTERSRGRTELLAQADDVAGASEPAYDPRRMRLPRRRGFGCSIAVAKVPRLLRDVTVLVTLLGAAGGAGCMTKRQTATMRTGQGEAMPVIEVQPGLAGRIALMDEYRLHDETRKHMMRRPHVTVEELPPDEPAGEDAGLVEEADEKHSDARAGVLSQP